MKRILLLISLFLISLSFISATDLTENYQKHQENCVPIYDFIVEHYNGTLTYLIYEFEDLQNETNLTTIELKDYLVNYESKCYLILPYDDYQVKEEKIEEKETEKQVTDYLKTMFKDTKSFLMVICFLILLILAIKMVQEK